MAAKVQSAGLSVAELRKREAKFDELLAQIVALFPEAHKLAKGDRRASQGKMGEEESAALRGVIDAIDLQPAVFQSLADDDEGHDPNKVETELLRERLDTHAIYSRIAEKLYDAATPLSDSALKAGALVKPVALAAYEIAKPISKRDTAMRGKIAKALDYYGGRTGKKDSKPEG